MTDPAETAPSGANSETEYGCPVSYSGGQKVIHCDRENWQELAIDLLNDDWNMAIDITGVDYLGDESRQLPASVTPERFEVVLNLISHERKERIRVRTQVPESDPKIGSLYAIYPGVDYSERETYDMFGIEFDGHPDLSRILMPESWNGHPLRKDYETGTIPVRFKHPQGGK